MAPFIISNLRCENWLRVFLLFCCHINVYWKRLCVCSRSEFTVKNFSEREERINSRITCLTNQRRSTNSSSEFRSFSFVIRNWRTDFRWALCFYLRQDLTTKCTLGNLLFHEHTREAIEHKIEMPITNLRIYKMRRKRKRITMIM